MVTDILVSIQDGYEACMIRTVKKLTKRFLSPPSPMLKLLGVNIYTVVNS